MSRRSRERISAPLDLHSLATSMVPFDRDAFVAAVVDESCERYGAQGPSGAKLVEVADGHGYRFVFDGAGAADGDAPEPRVVAAWGRARANPGRRDASRMRGFPLARRLRGDHDRGHLFSHAAGGGTDVNLFIQARALNRGWSSAGRRWRALERLAVLRPDAVLVVRLVYDDDSVVPAVLQAALVDDAGIICTEYLSNR